MDFNVIVHCFQAGLMSLSTGSLGIVMELYRQKSIAPGAARAVLSIMMRSGCRLPENVVNQFLHDIGQPPLAT